MYLYDGSGNIKAVGLNNYRYDTAGRLISATVNGGAYTQTYEYDAFGNRTLSTTVPVHGCIGGIDCEENVPITPGTNHIGSSGTVYDAAGNLTVLDSVSYTYDSQSMLQKQSNTGARFIYTASDERIAAISSGIWSWALRDLGGKVLTEYTSADGSSTVGNLVFHWERDYIYRDGLLLAANVESTVEHFHLDHLGTPRLITNASGGEIGAHTYFPFGAELALTPVESPVEAMKFTGHERDFHGSAQDLDYMHARYFGAAIGRFLAIDPELDFGKATRSPQMWNRYAYVLNNPLRYRDPDGREADPGEWDGHANPRALALAKSLLHIDDLCDAFSGWGSASAKERAMAVSVGLISVADVGANFLAPEEAPVGVLLGENMARVTKGADQLGLKIFKETGDTFFETMAKNMQWLADQVKSGARIFDIGLDVSRGGLSGVFFKAEVAFMESLGYERRFVKLVDIEGKTYRMFEWVKVAN